MKKILILAFIFGLIGFHCKKEDPATGQTSLLKTKWILSYICDTWTNAITKYPDNIHQEYIIFSDSINVLTVGGVCNGCKGNYIINSDLISINGLACTMIYCSQWEDYLFNNLDSMYQYKINNNQLTIYSKGKYNLNFIAE